MSETCCHYHIVEYENGDVVCRDCGELVYCGCEEFDYDEDFDD